MLNTRKLTSFIFSAKKKYKQISSILNSPLFLLVLIIGVSVFLLGGGIYDIVNKPIAVFPMGSRIIFYYPYYIHEQFLNESIVIMILYALGVSGLFLIYKSTGYLRTPRQATILLAAGILFFVISYVMVEAIIYWKMNFS